MPDVKEEPVREPMNEAERKGVIVKTSVVGIVANVLLAAFKAAIGVLSNSIAIVLDAVNNISDALSSIITIIGTRLAGKAPDRDHPYGHGRYEYITTFVIAAIVLWAGVTSLQESVTRIIHPVVPSYRAVSLVIVAVAVLAKVVLGLYVRRKGKLVDSGSLIASGTDALMDAIISASTLVAALVFVFTGVSLEAWLGAIISLVIIKAGIDILREAITKILGERIDADFARQIKETVKSADGVMGAYDLMLNDYGPDRLWGSVHVEVADTMTAAQIDELTRKIQQAVYSKHKVMITTVGVYSVNTEHGSVSEMRRRVYEMALAHEHVLELHGFYADEEAKRARFDLVVSFDAPDRKAVFNDVAVEVAKAYPDYRFDIALDSDISD